ncbi:MFS transporter [Sphingobacterium spiritivorum]|uniref:Drug resistance MFS transporter, drug:H+ antiporter-2 family n=1 Tax=Sphingobacterium spiritivorum ATCC 33861 TaxID=525373 RepID=D7VMW4_SPHSI|nr:MFS transporter [Sphingobacterium spiritivorum]EFK57261.1 drug resistance MFS transporter, drug:H+ antiporter-2 family [Sphingobacterium spiritivorum ATCC 33861]QQT36653.1 MFS transporter [Sphingobacterium spiritivorum]WQD33405.1 MFS transporter [Sphingobacterium spiritivorum]SUJ23210.1 Spectinomycin tetracycline efflux pump [Sphingobacterium spiritivorum]
MKNTSPLEQSTPYSKRWAALFLLCTAEFLVIMDTSIIGVALPAIKADLGYTQTGLQWIFNAYVILFGGFLLLGGRLSDLFGARKIFMWGFVILTLASLLAGVAWSEATLNIGRALQGLGSAFIAPAALTLVLSKFTDPKELNKALGFWGASAAAGGSAGVFLGGAITEWLSWHWIFLINIPVGIIVLLRSPSLLFTGEKRKGKVDMAGAILATASLILMVYAIVSSESEGWGSVHTIGLLVLSIALLIAFYILQKQKSEPLVPMSIFKVPNLSAGNIVMALLAAAWIPLWFFLNLYLQQTLHYSAFNSGLALLPMTLAIMFLMVGVTGKLVAKFGFKSNMIVGLLALAGSLILFSLVPSDGTFVANVLPASLLGAVGMSLTYIPGTVASMSGAKPEETGLASGLVNTSYQVGSALGLAIIVAISAARTNALKMAGEVEAVALNSGFQTAFFSAGIICIVATVIAAVSIRTMK